MTFEEFFGGSDGLQRLQRGFRALNPIPAGTYGFGPFELQQPRLLVAHRRLDRWSRSRCLLVWLLMRSPWGRVLKGIREDEDAVRGLGKNVYLYKMQALILGGVFGTIAGIVFVLGRGPCSPRSTPRR